MVDHTILCPHHGVRKWDGDVVCDKCKKIYMYPDIPQICNSCKATLRPFTNRTVWKSIKFTASPLCPVCSGRILPWWAKWARFFLRRNTKKGAKNENIN